ncbi:phage portal protein [Virgibacillus natechei]
MTKLDDYIKDKHKGQPRWFIDEVKSFKNQERIREANGIRDYLSGEHNILKRENYEYNGEVFEPRKIVMQYAKTLLDFQRTYLLANPITLTGVEEVVEKLNKVNNKGKYKRINKKILDKVLKYGEVYEYVYKEGRTIKSKIIDTSEGFPIYNSENVMIGFIEAYVHDGIEYYTVFSEDTVESYKFENNRIVMTARNANLTGLPIAYVNENEISDVNGRSDLEDWITILDAMEDLVSKYQDTVYKFMNPIPVVTGQQLKGEGLPADIVGGGMNLDDGATFRFEGNQLDSDSFESLYKKHMQSLLDISNTPAVSMNKADISNLSEVSIKMMFSLANTKASINEQIMQEGIESRHDRIRTLLGYDGIQFNDEDYDTIDMQFTYNMPSNDTEVIENLKGLREMNGISVESMLEKSPYSYDTNVEMERLNGERNVSEGNVNREEE